MSFLSDLGSFIGEVNQYKDDITSTFKGVQDDVKSFTDEATEIKDELVNEVRQVSDDIQSDL